MNPEENTNQNNFRNLREKKGLSIAEISDKLKLTPQTIKKLEDSNFDGMGAYIYVRGYVKHYADLLGVDAEEYLALIPKAEMKVPLVNTKSNTTKTIKFKRRSKNFASYTLGTFIVVAVSFSGWFLLKNYQGKTVNSSNSIEISKSNEIEITPQKQSTQFDNSQAPMQNNQVQDEQYHLSSLIPSMDEGSDDANSQLTIPEQTSIDSLGNDEGQQVQEPDTKMSGMTSSDNGIKKRAYEIIISAKKTSWVKVEHLNGEKLHNDLMQPGELSFNSDEPVHFRIGNKDQVSVMINGDVIDLSKYSSKNIADFKWPIDS